MIESFIKDFESKVSEIGYGDDQNTILFYLKLKAKKDLNFLTKAINEMILGVAESNQELRQKGMNAEVAAVLSMKFLNEKELEKEDNKSCVENLRDKFSDFSYINVDSEINKLNKYLDY